MLAAEKTTDAIFDSMKSLNAYATTGDRIILDFSVNDTSMGQRAPFTTERRIRGQVIGTAPIDNITLIKNDTEVWRYDYLTANGDLPGEKEALLLSFASDSKPVQPGDNPRGWRHWRGTLRVENARILSAQGRDFHNLAFQTLTVRSVDTDAIQVYPETQGLCSRLGLDPLGLLASGALLIACGQRVVKELCQELDAADIMSRVIGLVGADSAGVHFKDGRVVRKAVTDEMLKVFDEN